MPNRTCCAKGWLRKEYLRDWLAASRPGRGHPLHSLRGEPGGGIVACSPREAWRSPYRALRRFSNSYYADAWLEANGLDPSPFEPAFEAFLQGGDLDTDIEECCG